MFRKKHLERVFVRLDPIKTGIRYRRLETARWNDYHAF